MVLATPPKCCFCSNVKVGTTIIAVLFMIAGFGGLFTVGYSMTHINAFPEISSDAENDTYEVFQYMDQSSSSKCLYIALHGFISIIAILSIVGIKKNKHCYIWPMLALQLFLILRTLISLCSIIFSWSTIRLSIILCSKLPYKVEKWLLSLDDYQLAFVIYGTFFLVLTIKFYLFSIVHKCYNHIKFTDSRNARTDTEAGNAVDVKTAELPDYNEIHKFPLATEESDGVKPPPYAE